MDNADYKRHDIAAILSQIDQLKREFKKASKTCQCYVKISVIKGSCTHLDNISGHCQSKLCPLRS